MEEKIEDNSKIKSRKRNPFKNKDYFVIIFTIICLISIFGYLTFVTVHTNIDLSKNEKGEISLSVEYNVDNEVEIPGKDLLPMAKQVLNVVKKKLN